MKKVIIGILVVGVFSGIINNFISISSKSGSNSENTASWPVSEDEEGSSESQPQACNPPTELNCSNSDLRGANLRRMDLSRGNFEGANLTGADLSFAKLNYANFSHATLFYSSLDGIAANADFSYANLSHAKFGQGSESYSQIDLTNADFTGSDLSYAKITFCTCLKTNFSKANLFHTWIDFSNLYGAKLPELNLEETVVLSSRMPDGKDLDGYTP